MWQLCRNADSTNYLICEIYNQTSFPHIRQDGKLILGSVSTAIVVKPPRSKENINEVFVEQLREGS
jgi:hypothetical protein